jgi:ATP-dependent RNA helicase RhlE
MVAEDASHVQSIERFIGQKIPREKIENFDYKYTALFDQGVDGVAGRRTKGVRVSGGYHFGSTRRRRR